ncbi:hypothetical protein [Sulfitobacter mediterraneus]|uniref:hypothetical protein n=1 Tax=Sulfitobacter mediterraneus TaxID=83219 RepID=UPI000A73BF87|nr:hypothetical protein [Sulfitobacter mediterraneus]
MKRLIGLLALTALASCGADGEPVRPAANDTAAEAVVLAAALEMEQALFGFARGQDT